MGHEASFGGVVAPRWGGGEPSIIRPAGVACLLIILFARSAAEGRPLPVSIPHEHWGDARAGLLRRHGGPARSVWAKHDRDTDGWLPLWRHMKDSAAVAGLLWNRWLPAGVRRLMAEALPRGESDARALAAWLVGVHDIGKATPAFACQVDQYAGQGRALLAHTTNNEQGFIFRPHDHSWHPTDHEGITLIHRPDPNIPAPTSRNGPPTDWSRASKRRRFGRG
ncbi:type I-E CRISPR-associated endoribonuclease Cas2 [Streptomyces sp. NPDC006367]|uniref:type I-E CRISPR-associated endoribonuclease Cas2 n=1 Tax=unclassified Streptomyces TaxID=2593676 RepID=UPI0033B25A09